MSLNIKKERVHDLAREAAALTGESQTSVIEIALEQLIARLSSTGSDGVRARVDALLATIDSELSDETRAALLADELYDADGLPA